VTLTGSTSYAWLAAEEDSWTHTAQIRIARRRRRRRRLSVGWVVCTAGNRLTRRRQAKSSVSTNDVLIVTRLLFVRSHLTSSHTERGGQKETDREKGSRTPTSIDTGNRTFRPINKQKPALFRDNSWFIYLSLTYINVKTFQFKTWCKSDKSRIQNSTDHFCKDTW